jgi:ppGpp synthetase/RelA/SpoT-type nucleotidyltranferase
MSDIFSQYDKGNYINWHKENVEAIDFEAEVLKLRENLKENSHEKLNTLAQLLMQIKERTEPECRIQSKGLLVGEFQLPTKSFSEKSSAEGYDLLFKSTDSIIEKCWRKNAKRKSEYVSIYSLPSELTDLIRTSVVCPTLQHAGMFTERLSAWRDFLPAEDIEEHFSSIDRVDVDQEAKPASGYFAYHVLVHFNDGLAIEVQFYSLLSSAWRNMSHKLYEKTRVGSSPFMGPGTPEARLISLGHMLHLAEFELNRLTEDLKKSI